MILVYLIIVAIVAPSHDAMRLDWTVGHVLSFHVPCLSASDDRSISLECSLSALCQYSAMVFSLLSINENVVIRLAAEKRRQFVFVLTIKVFFIQKNKETRIQKNVARLCSMFTLFTYVHVIYNN